MECPQCGSEESKVIRTLKKYAEYNKYGVLVSRGYIVRHRLCEECTLLYSTKEEIYEVSKYDAKKFKRVEIKIEDYKDVENND